MIAAHRLGMTGGDYLFLMCTRYNGDFFGDYSWYRGDEHDEVTSFKSRDIIFLSDIQFTLIVGNNCNSILQKNAISKTCKYI
jgi:hypothetical protein